MDAQQINSILTIFDRWTESIGLPNDIKSLQNITPEEYKESLLNFYNKINPGISFRHWIESFYSKYEIDFDYLDLMGWEEWVRLYLMVLEKYIKSGEIQI